MSEAVPALPKFTLEEQAIMSDVTFTGAVDDESFAVIKRYVTEEIAHGKDNLPAPRLKTVNHLERQLKVYEQALSDGSPAGFKRSPRQAPQPSAVQL